MLKKRIIKGLILIIISFMIYLGNSNNCNAEMRYVETYRLVGYGGDATGSALQYVSYFNYEGEDQEYMFFCNRLG